MDDPVQSQPDEEKRQTKAPLIVGIGASAGAMDSIERFFTHLKLDSAAGGRGAPVRARRDGVRDGEGRGDIRLAGELRMAGQPATAKLRSIAGIPAGKWPAADSVQFRDAAGRRRPSHLQIGLELADDAVQQARGERIGHLPLEKPVTCDRDFQLSVLALGHDAALPSCRRGGGPVVSSQNLGSFSMVDGG